MDPVTAGALVSMLIAMLSVIYARRSVNQARHANDIGRLNALLALRTHYLELMARQAELAKELQGTSGENKANNAYADLDTELREVNQTIRRYHRTVTKADTPVNYQDVGCRK